MKERLAEILERSKGATLIAVSKFQPRAKIEEAYALGLRDFGENYAQELLEKAKAHPAPSDKDTTAAESERIRWHFIGRFQKNKINALKEHVHLWHTLASVADVQALMKRVPNAQWLAQVNIGREPQKGGVDPDRLDDLVALPGFSGLMCIPPDGPPEQWFDAMARLHSKTGGFLSMGMSDDFEVAIRYGATHIRIGTALFGPRQP